MAPPTKSLEHFSVVVITDFASSSFVELPMLTIILLIIF